MSMLAHVRPAAPLPQRPGIYAIVHTASGRCYIGSAVSLRARHQGHDWRLRHNDHPNRHLQNAWNKYGAGAFEFRVLDYVADSDELVTAEQAWIDALAPAFNQRKQARSNLGLTWAMRKPFSEESRRRMSEAKRGRVLTAEHRARIGAAGKGRRRRPEVTEKIRATRNLPGRRDVYRANTLRLWAEQLTPQALARKAGIVDPVLSIKQAAVAIGCSAASIRNFIRAGQLPATPVSKFWIIRAADLERVRPSLLAHLGRRKWPLAPRKRRDQG